MVYDGVILECWKPDSTVHVWDDHGRPAHCCVSSIPATQLKLTEKNFVDGVGRYTDNIVKHAVFRGIAQYSP